MNYLLIPIHIDALFLERDQLVSPPTADFSQLPYHANGTDYNPDTPNLSESVLSLPFCSHKLNLRKGLHLHWSLPDALTKGTAETEANEYHYPAVPNRWHIIRKRNGSTEKQWLVESDYMHPAGEPNTYNAISYPMDTASGQPFRYLGRQLDLSSTDPDNAAPTYLDKLTAVGYGEPSFAAFYPNCHSVFGCFDEEIIENAQLAGLSYQLLGWYSVQAKDPINELVIKNRTGYKEEIKEKLGWKISQDNNDVPTGMRCYAELTFNTKGKTIKNTKRQQPVTVSIGNTGTEALSAYVARKLNGNKNQQEEQLENLLMQNELQQKELDLGARFKEARHEKGFVSERGGCLWEIRPATEKQPPAHIVLPTVLSHQLHFLNVSQQKLEKAKNILNHKRHLLFSDWYKYMVSAYPPEGPGDNYPEIDLTKYFLEEKQLPLLKKASEVATTFATQLITAKERLDKQLLSFNESLIDKTTSSIPLDTDKADTTLLTLNGSLSWVENAPFSEYCLSLNGIDAYLSMKLTSKTKALSMWINLPVQNTDDATLLATASSGTLMSKNGVTDFLEVLAINGKEVPDNKPYTWADFPKDEWFHLYLVFTQPLVKEETLYLFGNRNTQWTVGKLASIRLFNAALTNTEISNDQNVLRHQRYELKEIVGPRYWSPSEPVILLEGASVEPTLRHGEDGRLSDDDTLEVDLATTDAYAVREKDFLAIDYLKKSKPGEKVGFQVWRTQPWHPFLLEWEVEIFPMQEKGNLDMRNRAYSPGFITANFELPEDSPELLVKDKKEVIKAAAIYSGKSILTPHAKKHRVKTIQNFLDSLEPEDCYQAISEIPETDKANYQQALADWYKTNKPPTNSTPACYNTWYLKKPVYNGEIKRFSDEFTIEKARLEDFNYAIIQSYVFISNAHCISQSLGGFNAALLMHHQTLQLPVADPLGFDDYQAFTNSLVEKIGNNNTSAPQPFNDFLPIRSGTMRINRLHIIDTFGQVKTDVITSEVVKSEVLDNALTNGSNDVWLPPRLVQPARINFRWLSSIDGRQELNSHPLNNPICGWLLPNHLDGNLSVYDQNGMALGYIDQQAKWRPTPGTDIPLLPSDIGNTHLRQVVERLAIVGEAPGIDKKTFFNDFINLTDQALENIDPEAFAHHQELALLMGRPIAIVRALINIELKGHPAIHHGWNVYRQDLVRDFRESNYFEAVKIPIRIGDRGQLNDGVLGYWKETRTNELDTIFHTTVALSEVVASGNIQSYEQAPLNIQQSINDSPQVLTLLIDPRGEVHATCGILPAKKIDIPKEQYVRALENINLTFLSSPILMAKDNTTLPLPNEMGFEWSWLEKESFQWKEITRTGLIQKEVLADRFENGAQIWQELLNKGWIKAINLTKAIIIPSDQRTTDQLGPSVSKQTDEIQQFLDAGHILPVSAKAEFSPRQQIREGWLKLSPSKAHLKLNH